MPAVNLAVTPKGRVFLLPSKKPARRAIRFNRRQRSGHLTAEALFVVPLLILISIAVVEFGMLLSLKQSVAHAAICGAREAAKGASLADVSNVAEQSLSGFQVTLSTNAGITVEDPDLSSVQEAGVLSCTLPTAALSGGKIRVTVCVESTGSPVSGLIAKFGAADLINKTLTKSAVAQKQCPFP